MDCGQAPQIRVLPSTDLFSLSHPSLHQAFSFGVLPPIEVVYWKGVGLIFRCSHALMDAGGLIFFAQETFRALREEVVLGTASNVSDYAHLSDLKHPQPRAIFWPDKHSPLGDVTTPEKGFNWDHRFIPGQFTAVTARLAAALGTVACAIRPVGRSRVMIPIDLRQFDPALRSTANLANAIFIEQDAVAGWSAYYRDILAALGRHDERAVSKWDAFLPRIPWVVLQKIFRSLHQHQVRNNRYLFSAVISNVAPIALSSLSASPWLPTSAALLPFDSPGTGITLIATQHDQGLELSASGPNGPRAKERLSETLDTLCAELSAERNGRPVSIAFTGVFEPMIGPRISRPDLTIYELFAEQAKIFSKRSALSENGRNITYGELEQLAIGCAYRLQNQGVRLGDRVAILADRRLESVIALLGILYLGASFVPIDPEWPRERISFVLSDCHPACLFTDEGFAAVFGYPQLMLSDLLDMPADVQHFSVGPSPKTPAYLLYTSGSTGQPKGVVVGQASFINYLLWAKDHYLTELDSPVVFPFFTSPAFDLTLTSIFLPLISGGEIRVFPQREALQTISGILSDSQINAAKMTPSHLRLFAGLGVGSSGLRKIIVGGEALPSGIANQIYQQLAGQAVIFNEYGPTEATVGCVMHRFDPERDLDAYVPIGAPIANTEVFLMDENATQVSDGESGEIYLSGACLALGYLARPSDEIKFAPHTANAGHRVYRTGDRARRLPDGELYFLGRKDDQVKVLGRRIEIGEIDAAIEASQLCVASAVVLEEFDDSANLAVFVTWRANGCASDLRQSLVKVLPAYMIPSRIVALDEMPLNVNGKVDKTQLPTSRPASREDTRNSWGEMEDAMRQIVLDITGNGSRAVCVDESLFDFGFDSLQMMLLLTLAAQRFLPRASHEGLFADLEDFIREPTLRNLAEHFRKLKFTEESV